MSNPQQLTPQAKLALGLHLTPFEKQAVIAGQMIDMKITTENADLIKTVLALKLEQAEFQFMLEREDRAQKKALYEQWEQAQKAHQVQDPTALLLSMAITSAMSLATLAFIYQQLFLTMHNHVVQALRNDPRLRNIRGYQINVPANMTITPPQPISKMVEKNPEILDKVTSGEDMLALAEAYLRSDLDYYKSQVISATVDENPIIEGKSEVLQDYSDIVQEQIYDSYAANDFEKYIDQIKSNFYSMMHLYHDRNHVHRIYFEPSQQDLSLLKSSFKNQFNQYAHKYSNENIQKSVYSNLDNDGNSIRKFSPTPFSMVPKPKKNISE